MPGSVLGTGDSSENRADESSCPQEAYILVEGGRQDTHIPIMCQEEMSALGKNKQGNDKVVGPVIVPVLQMRKLRHRD